MVHTAMRHPVKPGSRRLIAFICVVALLLTALTPVVSAAHHAVLVPLVPLDPLFGLVVIGEPLPIHQPASYRAPLLEITGSRPPPIL
jgi:hypothetical protein